MTIDRAIEILNPEHRECYDGLEEVNEACRMGIEALKLQGLISIWLGIDKPPEEEGRP